MSCNCAECNAEREKEGKGIQGELFVPLCEVIRTDYGFEQVITNEAPNPDIVCPICNNTGYTKGTRCSCSED